MTTKDIRYGLGQIVSSDGAPPGSIQARLASLRGIADKATKAFTDGEISAKDYNKLMGQAEQAQEELQTQDRTRVKALQYAGCGNSAQQWQANGGAPGAAQAKAHKLYTLKAGERFVQPPSLQTPGSREWQTLAEAARCKAPMSVEFDQGATGFGAVQLKGFTDGDGVRTKQTPVGEGVAGAGGSLIPPVLMPEMFAERLEPDRIWSHLTTVSAVGQWATYLQHPSDTYPAAPTAELATIPNTDAQYQAKIVVFTKISAQQAYSVEILEDTNSDVYAFAGSELSRKLIDAESEFLVNNTGTGNGWSTEFIDRECDLFILHPRITAAGLIRETRQERYRTRLDRLPDLGFPIITRCQLRPIRPDRDVGCSKPLGQLFDLFGVLSDVRDEDVLVILPHDAKV